MTPTNPQQPDTMIRKARRVYDLYHERCAQFVLGNGSFAMPYHCACGDWEYDITKLEWRLKNE